MITGKTTLEADPRKWGNVVSDQVRLLCNTLGGAVILTLPSIESIDSATNVELIIVDENNNAGTNNITIRTANTEAAVEYAINSAATDTVVITSPVIVFNEDSRGDTDAVITGWPGYNGIHQLNAHNRVGGTYQLVLGGFSFVESAIPSAARIAINTRVYRGDKFNNVDTFDINVNGGIAVIKVASDSKFVAFKSSI